MHKYYWRNIPREADTGSGTEIPAANPAPSSDDAGGFLDSGSQDPTPEGNGEEGKPAGESKGFLAGNGDDNATEDKGDDKPAEYDLKLPEGTEATEEEGKAYLDNISAFAQKIGLNKEQAQKMLEADLEAKNEGAAEHKAAQEQAEADKVKAAEKAVTDTKASLKEAWGDDMDKNVRTANRALKEFGGSELEGVLSEAGVLNNSTVIQAFHKAGLSLVEDSSPGGAGASRRNRSAAEILYPSSTKEG